MEPTSRNAPEYDPFTIFHSLDRSSAKIIPASRGRSATLHEAGAGMLSSATPELRRVDFSNRLPGQQRREQPFLCLPRAFARLAQQPDIQDHHEAQSRSAAVYR
jgi:hypothetical protein